MAAMAGRQWLGPWLSSIEQLRLTSGLVIMTALVFIAANGHYNCSTRAALSIWLLIQH